MTFNRAQGQTLDKVLVDGTSRLLRKHDCHGAFTHCGTASATSPFLECDAGGGASRFSSTSTTSSQMQRPASVRRTFCAHTSSEYRLHWQIDRRGILGTIQHRAVCTCGRNDGKNMNHTGHTFDRRFVPAFVSIMTDPLEAQCRPATVTPVSCGPCQRIIDRRL
jgi:hypothetical protein